jgi:twitching motility protein PilT
MKNSLDDILKSAVKVRASDVHLVVGQPPVVRVDGDLHSLKGFAALEESDTQGFATDMLVKPQRERFYQEKELDTAYEDENGTRYRVNFHWATGNVGIAIRVLSSKIPTMDELTLPAVAYDMIKEESGLILLTGPTGCGKTTTMASMIDKINLESGKHIITLEDPIEYRFESKNSIVKQREYGTDFLSFPEGLKRGLRQDPDVIMVGEMRDLETISLAITAAETGHLVFATLHTYSGPQTIDRIVDSFPPYQQNQIRLQVSLTLKAVISQRLLTKVGGGRVAAREILINTNAASNLIRENKIAQLGTVIETGGKYGMITMDRALRELIDLGVVAEDEAMIYANNRHGLG